MKKETIGLVLFLGGAVFAIIMTWGLLNMFLVGNINFTSDTLQKLVTQIFLIGVGVAAFFIGKELKD